VLEEITVERESVVESDVRSNGARWFYVGAGVFLLVLTLMGFQRFYLHGQTSSGQPITPEIRSLIVLHGIVMSAWIMLFLIQPLLIVSRKSRIHMTVGKIGGVLAVMVIVLGLKVGIESKRYWPEGVEYAGLDAKEFTAFPVAASFTFAGFVVVGIWKRRQAHAHRAMMLLATITLMDATVVRIGFVREFIVGSFIKDVFADSYGSSLVGLLLGVVGYCVTRKFDRWYMCGYAVMVLVVAITHQVAQTEMWRGVAGWLLG
jgi:hypothetical protein